jgi:hypothetical protein
MPVNIGENRIRRNLPGISISTFGGNLHRDRNFFHQEIPFIPPGQGGMFFLEDFQIAGYRLLDVFPDLGQGVPGGITSRQVGRICPVAVIFLIFLDHNPVFKVFHKTLLLQIKKLVHGEAQIPGNDFMRETFTQILAPMLGYYHQPAFLIKILVASPLAFQDISKLPQSALKMRSLKITQFAH